MKYQLVDQIHNMSVFYVELGSKSLLLLTYLARFCIIKKLR